MTDKKILRLTQAVMVLAVIATYAAYFLGQRIGRLGASIDYMQCYNRTADAFTCADIWVVKKP